MIEGLRNAKDKVPFIKFFVHTTDPIPLIYVV